MSDPLYTSFSSVPVRARQRRALFREARLGTRPVPVIVNVGDAVKAVAAAAAYKDGWTNSEQLLSVTVRAAWEASQAHEAQPL